MRRTRFMWILPVTTALAGAVLGLASNLQQGQLVTGFSRSFEQHVDAVSRLVQEGARQASAATALVNTEAQARLAVPTRLLLARNALPADTRPLRCFVVQGASGITSADWGSVPQESRPALMAQVLGQPPGALVEDGVAAELGLYCSHAASADGTALACRALDELRAWRGRVGLEPLLREVSRQGVFRAVLQDESGVLAASPSPGPVSTWADDPFLGRALAGEGLAFRTIDVAGQRLLEGVTAFPKPDGAPAVLRVGVDASVVGEARTREAERHRTLLALVGMLVLASILATLLVDRAERKWAQAQRDLSATESEHEHWRQLGQMSSTVAHEIRNPLNTVLMAAHRLEREFTVPAAEEADFKELLWVLKSEAERVGLVVGDLLELGRPLSLSLEEVPARRVLEDALALFRVRATQEHKTLDVNLDADSTICVDPQRMKQVLGNLLSNALEAVAVDGTVRVRTALVGAGLCVSITDDGPGMDAETLARLHEPFHTTKARGTGLGIPLALRLAKAQGGQLTFSSQPGSGTVAVLHFPPPRKTNRRSLGAA